MQGVITHGTAQGSAEIGRQAAGKTGTTEGGSDTWFVGYTPSLSTAVWLGNSSNNRTFSYRGKRDVYGATVSAPTWAKFMKAALKDVPQTEFTDPAPITKVNTNVLAQTVSTLPQAISPKTKRTPGTTPTVNANQINNAPPGVKAPASITTTTTAAAPVPTSVPPTTPSTARTTTTTAAPNPAQVLPAD